MRMKRIIGLFAIAFGFTFSTYAQNYTENGVELRVENALMNVEFVKNDIVRVRYTHNNQVVNVDNEICVKRESPSLKIRNRESNDVISLKSDSLEVTINKLSGMISYYDKKGNLLLNENPVIPHNGEKIYEEKVTFDESTRRTIKTANGDTEVVDVLKRDTIGSSWKWRLNLTFQKNEALYGLGCHMEDYMNLRGKKVYLCQHNLKEMVPVLNSTAGYGLLINAGSEMTFNDIKNESYIEVGAAPQLDYYFMKGYNMDATVKNYRWLTGDVPMMPLYLFGYTQSKERYTSSAELIGTLKQFRTNHIPIDMIVQDWNYWEPGSWGHMKMNTRDYPDKKALTDAIHAMNAKLMISIWPSMTNSPQEKDFRERGMILPGTNVYNAFSSKARDLYWEYANNEFFKNGFDAWWCDSTEPIDADWSNMGDTYSWDSHKKRFELCHTRLSDGLGHERSQLFSLFHSKGIYEHQRNLTNEKRVVNLTRSSYAGQQRYGTIVWNGDTHASWKAFQQMIPAGLNFTSTGCPYWTVDIGAFFVKKGWAWFYIGDYDKGVEDLGYRELYVRMLQYATFLPMMRSHGTDTPREPWRFGGKDSPFYQTIVDYIRLRYRLLPYTYSLAADVSFRGGTMLRSLAFDFHNDENIKDIKDQFMLGHNLLVAPVTKPMYYGPNSTLLENTDKHRDVYLPKGKQWIDFYNNKVYEGGQTITIEAPLERIPVFVPSGSIIPMCIGNIEYTEQYKNAEWEIRIYPGEDAKFIVYQDKGDGYDYEKGEYAEFLLQWNDHKQTLTISERSGKYIPENVMKMKVLLPDGRKKDVIYTGKKITVKMKGI